MKLALFDKDGTLTLSQHPSGFITVPQDQTIKPGTLELVEKHIKEGYKLVVISNQGGIAAKKKDLETVIAEMAYCNQLFTKALNRDVVFERFYFCPDFEGEICYCHKPYAIIEGQTEFTPDRCIDVSGSNGAIKTGAKGKFRKPNPGMLNLAINWLINASDINERHGEPLEHIIMIGDRPEDEQAAQAAKVEFKHIDSYRKPSDPDQAT